MELEFTGEYYVPGKVDTRIEDDHIERYKFTVQFGKGQTILDIACGVGYGSFLLSKGGAVRVDGVDISEKVIEYARSNYHAENLFFQTGDICEYKSNIKYDLIVCYETIEHVKNYDKALFNIHRLLREGGLLIISSPNRVITSPNCSSMHDRPCNKFHIREFLIDELRLYLANNGFPIESHKIFGQRQQRHFKNLYLQMLYKKFFKPDIRKSAVVTPVRELIPRYFIIVAQKRQS